MTKESQRAIASLMALIQTTENADIILPPPRVSPPPGWERRNRRKEYLNHEITQLF